MPSQIANHGWFDSILPLFMLPMEEAVEGVTRKLAVLESLNLEALRAAIMGLRAAALGTMLGKESVLWKQAGSLERELLKLQGVIT